MDEAQIKQIIERQPLHGTALLDPRCKILLLVCIGFVSYFLAGEVVSLALMLVYGLFITLGNGGKWAAKMIITYIIVAYLNALLRYVQVPVLSVIMSVFGVTVLKLIPIVMMGLWILRTTYIERIGAVGLSGKTPSIAFGRSKTAGHHRSGNRKGQPHNLLR